MQPQRKVAKMWSSREKLVSDRNIPNGSGRIQSVCKYYNTGFCKFKAQCTSYHPTNICPKTGCRDKACPNRHPKKCRYKDQCRRRSTCLYCHDKTFSQDEDSVVTEFNVLKAEVKKLVKDISILKAENEIKIANLVKAQIVEIGELKEANLSLNQSLKQVQELYKDTLAFKEDIRKEIQKIYKDNTDNQATLRDYIERVTDDFSNLSESLDIFKELTTNKVKFLRVSIQNQKQTFNCVYCNNIFENDNELIKHNEHYPLACEECNVCFERRLPGKIIHSRHDHSSKRKLLVV